MFDQKNWNTANLCACVWYRIFSILLHQLSPLCVLHYGVKQQPKLRWFFLNSFSDRPWTLCNCPSIQWTLLLSAVLLSYLWTLRTLPPNHQCVTQKMPSDNRRTVWFLCGMCPLVCATSDSHLHTTARLWCVRRVQVALARFCCRYSARLWSSFCRVRVRMSRKRNEEEDSGEKLFTLVEFIPTKDFKKLQTTTVDDADEAE